MENAHICPTPMTQSQKLFSYDTSPLENPTLYRSIIRALQYLTMTRPSHAYSVNNLSQFLSTPTKNHSNAYKRVLRYLKGTLSYGFTIKLVLLLNLHHTFF